MLILLSPAKNLNEDRAAGHATTTPRFLDQAEELTGVMRSWSEEQIGDLMKVSPKIARLTAQRAAAWSRRSGAAQGAGDMFDGDAYKSLEMATMDDATRADAAQRLRLLSGLYGLLRPTDDICAYRLEMGRKLPGHPAGTLYEFWGPRIAQALKEDAATLGTDAILNLASDEYAKAVDKTALAPLRLISPRFEEERRGVRKVISFSAKRARGAMTRWVLEEGVTDPDALPRFSTGGYTFDEDASTPECPVFVRPEAPDQS